ncbi:MAG: hypothetical protein K6B41_05985, partial [Butyrivibrio sp.]|nr:hypothetical protein [Butyrivibrio sp.]
MGLDLENEETEVKAPAKRQTKKTKEMLEEYSKQLEELDVQDAELSKQMDDLRTQTDALGEIDAVGMKVKHKKFGAGEIVAQDGKYIDVKFSDVVKKFVLPGAIAERFLKVEDENTLEYYIKRYEIHNKKIKIHMAQRSNEYAKDRINDA